MKYVCTVLFFLSLSVCLHSIVRLNGKDGWYAEIEIEGKYLKKKPFIFLIYNKFITNTEFLLQESKKHIVKLNLRDGDYQYSIFDFEKNIVEKGKLKLRTPFSIRIKKVFSDSALVEVETIENELINAIVYQDCKVISKKEKRFKGAYTFVFDNLPSGTNIFLEFSSGTYRERAEIRTPYSNIALKKPVYGTFTKLPESKFVDDSTPAITRVNDGRLEWLKGMVLSGEVNNANQYVFINLQRVSNIKSIKVYWNAHYYPLHYSFTYSRDGTNWLAMERNTNFYKNEIAGDNTPMVMDEINTNIEAYYIGIIIDKGTEIKTTQVLRNYVELLEIEAYE